MNASAVVIAAFSEEQTGKLTGLSIGQLRYWDRTNFYHPSYTEKRPMPFGRVYAFRDIVALRVLFAFRRQFSVSLQHLRVVSEKLSHLGPDPDRWTKVSLYAINKRVVWHEEGTRLPQEIASGQYVSAIVLSDVVLVTKRDLSRLHFKRDREDIGEVERDRNIMRNQPVIAGTRIPVGTIRRFRDAGYTTKQILKEYPSLTGKDVSAALKYKDRSAA